MAAPALRAALAAVSLLGAAAAPRALVAQTRPLELSLVTSVTPEDGGPERLNTVLAVSSSGLIAFTLGFDRSDRHVTVLDAQQRLRARVGGQGSGPGEFTGVLALEFVDSTLYVAGAGQVSAFGLSGRHLWSRALPPLQLMIAASRDSIDLLDATYFADGRGVGSVYRRATRRGGGDRLLLDGRSPALRRFARNADDSTRFPRLGLSTAATTMAVANSQTGAVLLYSADGVLRDTVVAAQPVRRRTPRELERDAADAERLARRPFRLPDGRFIGLPFDAAAERQRLRAPVPYFNVRRGGFHFDAATGSSYFIEARGDSTRITRYGPSRGSTATATVACSGRDAASAIAPPYLLIGCAVDEEGDLIPTLRLYRIR